MMWYNRLVPNIFSYVNPVTCKGGIPYTDHGAQITPPLFLIFVHFFVFMLILG